MLGIFERFPDEDAYGVFGSILHCLERCCGYQALLVDSAIRVPVEFNLSMVHRLLNSGVSEVDGHRLLGVLEAAASSPKASSNTKDLARSFIEYQWLLMRQGPDDSTGAKKMSEDSTPSIASGVGVFFVRLFLGGIGFVVVLALAMLSGIPYGGGSSALFLLAWGVLIATPAWALAPLIRAAFHRRNAPDDSGT